MKDDLYKLTKNSVITCHPVTRFSSSDSAILTSLMMKLNENMPLNAKSVRFTAAKATINARPIFLDGISKATDNSPLELGGDVYDRTCTDEF